VGFGLYMTNSGKTKISPESEHAVHHVWGYIGFVAETLIFILSGIIMGERASSEDNLIGYKDYIKLLGTYVILHIIRFFMILVFWPCLQRLGYGMTFEQVILCSYAGLRGAVGMSLALMVAASEEVPTYI
jgi:NhaP-type Na+/H+ or K+/H+ antiporter